MGSSRPGVLVFGSINMDHLVRVRTLPAPGETVLSRGYQSTPGGKGRNQAVAVASVGGTVSIAGAVGDDPAGELLLADLDRSGVERSMVQIVADSPSGLALITVDAGGENTIVVHPGANSRANPVRREAVDPAVYRVMLCSLEVPLPSVKATLDVGRALGLITVVNAAPVDAAADETLEAVLLGADVVIVNRSEAVALAQRLPQGSAEQDRAQQGRAEQDRVGRPGPAEGPEIPAERVAEAVAFWLRGEDRKSARLPTLIMTLGGEGAAYVDAGGAHHVPAYQVKVASAVGAGDAFAGVLCHALACGRRIDESVELASAAAAAHVSGGLSSTSLAEIIRRPVA
ncbi:MAG: ribokinase [Acidimicrobiales bacterium]